MLVFATSMRHRPLRQHITAKYGLVSDKAFLRTLVSQTLFSPSAAPSICCRGGELELGGVKWWTTGACLPTCAICIFMGKTDAAAAPHRKQSMVLVPMDTPGRCKGT
jgi:hypothetical protein